MLVAQDNNVDAIFDSIVTNSDLEATNDWIKINIVKNQQARYLAYSYLINGENQKSIEQYLYYLQNHNDTCFPCMRNLTNAYFNLEKGQDALSFMTTKVEVYPENVDFLSLRSRIYAALGQKVDARMDISKAIKISENKSPYYIQRAELYIDQNMISLAKRDLNSAYLIDENNAVVHFLLGQCYFIENELDLALHHVNNAIKIDSTNSSFYNARGSIYARQEKYQSAISDYYQLLQDFGADPLIYYNLNLCYYKLEQLDSSCYYLHLASQHLQKNDIELKKDIESGLKEHCDRTTANYYYQRGIGYYNLNQPELSIKYYDTASSISPNSSMIESLYGNAYMKLDQFENAIVHYKKSIALKEGLKQELFPYPKFNEQGITDAYSAFMGTTYSSMGESYLYLHEYTLARTHFDSALIYIPKEAEELVFNANKHYCIALMVDNQREEALKRIEQLRQSDKNNPIYPLYHILCQLDIALFPDRPKLTTNLLEKDVQFEIIPLRINKEKKEQLLNLLPLCDQMIQSALINEYAFGLRAMVKYYLDDESYCEDIRNSGNVLVESNVSILNCK